MTDSNLKPVTEWKETSIAPDHQQLERILQSSALRNSATLRQLLQFLGTRAIEGNSEGLKEYTIGVEAFGRKPDFDPKTDPIVRVQTHRLRQKLKEYYEQEGANDPILIEIPKGHYYPTFAPKVASSEPSGLESNQLISLTEAKTNIDELPSSAHGTEELVGESAEDAPHHRSHQYMVGAIALIGILLFALALGFMLGNYRKHNAVEEDAVISNTSRLAHTSADPVSTFWAAFLGNDSAPIIAYANAVFLLDDSNDLFRFRQGASDNRGARVDDHLARQFASNPALVAKAGQLYYENGYTGTGELESVARLTALFTQMGAKPTIKTSRDITPEDLQQHAVILLGSPFQNIAAAQLLTSGDFSFQNPDSRREQWRGQIVNAHPNSDENSVYRTERDPDTQVLKRDYSLISIQPGVVAGHNIAVIAGLDTKGTEGAVQFVTSRAGVEELSAALSAKGLTTTKSTPTGKEEMPWFQALTLVHLEKGDQVLNTELISVHPVHLKKSRTLGESVSAPPIRH